MHSKSLLSTTTHRVAWEQWPMVDHLHKDAANGPDVHWGGVGLGTQQDLRGAVPQRHHLQQKGGSRSAGLQPP